MEPHRRKGTGSDLVARVEQSLEGYKKEFWLIGNSGEFSRIIPFITQNWRNGPHAGLIESFYEGVQDGIARESDEFERAFRFVGSFNSFIPYGNADERFLIAERKVMEVFKHQPMIEGQPASSEAVIQIQAAKNARQELAYSLLAYSAAELARQMQVCSLYRSLKSRQRDKEQESPEFRQFQLSYLNFYEPRIPKNFANRINTVCN